MELGIYSFGELGSDPTGGGTRDARTRLDQVVELAKVADAGGLDALALGEHHRLDFAISSPEVVLAAVASVTSRIRLASGVTVLSSQDPVRVFEQFATLDLLSNGRAEIFAGRGAFTESFPLYHRAAAQAGHDPAGLRLGVSGHMYVGATSQAAKDDFFPYYARYFQGLGGAGGGAFTRNTFEQWIAHGLPVGSPAQVVDAIMRRVELLGIDRFLGQIDVGNLPEAMSRESLELYITEVAPVLRRETAGTKA